MPRKPPERPAKPVARRVRRRQSPNAVDVSAAPSPRRRAARKAAAPAAAELRARRRRRRTPSPPAAPREADEPRRDAPQAKPGDAAARRPFPISRRCRATSRALIEEGGKVLAAYFKPREGRDPGQPGEEIAAHGGDASAASPHITSPTRNGRLKRRRRCRRNSSNCGRRRCAGCKAKRPRRSPRPIPKTSASPTPSGAPTPISISSSRPTS